MHPSLSPDRTPDAEEREYEWARAQSIVGAAPDSTPLDTWRRSKAPLHSRQNNSREWIRLVVPVPAQQMMA